MRENQRSVFPGIKGNQFRPGIQATKTDLLTEATTAVTIVFFSVCKAPIRWLLKLVLCSVFWSLTAQAAFAVTAPYITPGTTTGLNSYTVNQMTVVITGDSGNTLYYTVDGSDPVSSGTRVTYSAPFTVNNYTTVKAAAFSSPNYSSVTTTYVQYEIPRSDLQLWLTPDNMVTSGSNVTSWKDISGYNISVAQGTAANQPTLVTNALNTYSAAAFNGATTNSSYLTLSWTGLTPAFSKPIFLQNLTGGVSVFAVIKPLASSTAKTLFTSNLPSGVVDLVALSTNGTPSLQNVVFNSNSASASNVTTTNTPVSVGSYQVLDVVHNGAASGSINVNGALAKAGTVQNLRNVSTRTVSRIGGNNALTTTAFWGGNLVELLVYGRGLTGQERAYVEGYLTYKYMLNNSQVTPPPVISIPTPSPPLTLSGPTQVAISAPPNAVVSFTLDGTAPVPGTSPTYSGPIAISYTQVLKAVSVINGQASSVVTASYSLDATQWPAPSGTSTPLQINLQAPTVSIP